MSSSWHLPQALGQSQAGAGVHSYWVNHPLGIYGALPAVCRVGDMSHGCESLWGSTD